jgi:putative DNA primase/helicase
MIEGCLRWQREGLAKPAAVEAATREYLEGEDTLLAWIEDKCECAKSYATAGELFTSWKAWAERNNEFVGSAKAFWQKLKERGFVGSHGRDENMYSGIHLRESENTPENEPWARHW